MKKLGLLSIIGCSVSGVAIAAGVDCNVIPTCAELGYTKSVADCEGQIILRCPFEITNDNAVFCQDKSSASAPSEPTIGQGCDAVGDILYNDLNCYDTAPSGKTAIGVVFDTENKLAVGLTRTGLEWGGYGTNITAMTDCNASNATTTCDIDGKTNTSRIVAALGSGTSYAAGYCYNQTTGALAKGSWFLPSFKELNTIYDNRSTIDSAITSAGGTVIGISDCWSSTEAGSDYALVLNMNGGFLYSYYGDKCTSYLHVRCAVSFAGGGSGDDNEESCSSDYSLDTCPTNGVCSECGGKKKLDSCTEGYELQDGACVAATPATGQGCTSVGSILYNDLNCYTTAPSGKTVIGVVFDTENRLAIGLTETSRAINWWSSKEDVSGLENCTSSTLTTSCGTSGKTNSAALVAAGYTNAGYAAGYCYNQTTGGLAKGDWFLPSFKELKTIYTNKSTINTAITSAGGTIISSTGYWSSNELSSKLAYELYMSNGNTHGLDKTSDYDYVRCAVGY